MDSSYLPATNVWEDANTLHLEQDAAARWAANRRTSSSSKQPSLPSCLAAYPPRPNPPCARLPAGAPAPAPRLAPPLAPTRSLAACALPPARRGDVEAHRQLGFRMLMGQGMPRDLAGAYREFQVAARGGDPYAMFNLGFMHIRGMHVEQVGGRRRACAACVCAAVLLLLLVVVVVVVVSDACVWSTCQRRCLPPTPPAPPGPCPQNYTQARKHFLDAADKKLPSALNGLGEEGHRRRRSRAACPGLCSACRGLAPALPRHYACPPPPTTAHTHIRPHHLTTSPPLHTHNPPQACCTSTARACPST